MPTRPKRKAMTNAERQRHFRARRKERESLLAELRNDLSTINERLARLKEKK